MGANRSLFNKKAKIRERAPYGRVKSPFIKKAKIRELLTGG